MTKMNVQHHNSESEISGFDYALSVVAYHEDEWSDMMRMLKSM
jgi:hypothetical protein